MGNETAGQRPTFCFYATFDASNLTSYIPAVPVLLPASSWARKGLRKPSLPDHVVERAADSGGFVASRVWGEYRYTLAQYVDWLSSWTPQWAACMDYCCEPELEVVTRERQDKTTANAWQAWKNYRSVPWAWVPTVQGLSPHEYRRHALELKPLIEEMQAYYGASSAWRVGIGTLCKRANTALIEEIVRSVLDVLPGVPLHLWGIKYDGLRSLDMQHIVSSDSAAWSGMWGATRFRLHELAHEQGMNRQTYLMKVVLPAYIERVQQAVERRDVVEIEPNSSLFKPLLRTYGYTLRIRTRRSKAYAYAMRRNGARVEEIYLSALRELSAQIIAQKLGNGPAGHVPNITDINSMD